MDIVQAQSFLNLFFRYFGVTYKQHGIKERPKCRRLNQRHSNVEPKSNFKIPISSAHEKIGVWTGPKDSSTCFQETRLPRGF